MLPPNVTEEKKNPSSALQGAEWTIFIHSVMVQYISDISQSKSWCLYGGDLQKPAQTSVHFERKKC